MTRIGLSALVIMRLHEIFGRHLADRLRRMGVGRPGVDEQRVEQSARQAVAQRCELIRLADVQDLDLDAAWMLVRQIVQHRSGAATSDGADDVPPFLQELGGHGVAETAG